MATQNFGNGFRPNWITSFPSTVRRLPEAPYLLEHGDEDKDLKNKNLNYSSPKETKLFLLRRAAFFVAIPAGPVRALFVI